jgi:hypothetical protein
MKVDLNQATEMIGRDILEYCADYEILEHAEELQNIVLDNLMIVGEIED